MTPEAASDAETICPTVPAPARRGTPLLVSKLAWSLEAVSASVNAYKYLYRRASPAVDAAQQRHLGSF